jgi:sugar/nucleoside kinase (ribokinase family)
MSKHGLFIGMVTLDLVYLTAGLPNNNQKIAAIDYTVTAGGPATNAAVAFSHLGNQATLLSVLGSHPITNLIQVDLTDRGVAIADLEPTRCEPPPVSSIIVTQSTGERAVVSLNSAHIQAAKDQIPFSNLQDVDVVLIDGHQMEVGLEIAKQAQSNQIPIVIDGGSWKPGFEQVLSLADYVICSANFYPPNCHSSEDTLTYLSGLGIKQIAITQGEKPIHYVYGDQTDFLEVPQTNVVDTLGAGDIFHGAFCHFILQTDFITALTEAAKIAAYACQFFGTRRWMQSNHSDAAG